LVSLRIQNGGIVPEKHKFCLTAYFKIVNGVGPDVGRACVTPSGSI